MNVSLAQRIIESLRKGIPPDGFVRQFTVGRKNEIDDLIRHLEADEALGLMINANYGSGKTHLLRLIREEALDRNYVVSSVTLNSKSEVRFNRMDQILGAVCRSIELPGSVNERGLRPFMEYIRDCIDNRNGCVYWNDLTNNGKWDLSESLDSPALFVAMRAWMHGTPEVSDFAEDWLYQSWQYKSQRKKLYLHLIESLRKHFRDPRPEWMFYGDGILSFEKQGYAQSWAALRDLDSLARATGFKGLIILFDEFEDIITNLRNVAYQETAFWNMFHFNSSKHFSGKTFYAVTPEFVEKCKSLLMEKGRWEFDLSRFDALPSFEMSPLEIQHLREMASKLIPVHARAYDWDPSEVLEDESINRVLENSSRAQIQDRTRHAIIRVVKHLDDCLQGKS